MKKQVLTPNQAFQAMAVFLESYAARLGGGADIESLLGDLQVNPSDGKPMDPAAWDDWMRAVESALENSGLETSGESTYSTSQRRKRT